MWAVTQSHKKLKATTSIYQYLRLEGNISIGLKNSQTPQTYKKTLMNKPRAEVDIELVGKTGRIPHHGLDENCSSILNLERHARTVI